MTVDYILLATLLGGVYALVKYLLPDLPIDLPTLLTFVVYVLLKLGVEIVNKPIKAYLRRQGLIQ